ncbi:MAG: GTP-binding protein [Lachnospiraceae bacterium]|nr:GTP-binding protein [Lachnospiraceae bacterium]
MIHLVLLTGFLGAGKTTFLNHILEEYKDEKIGLIVNEFSETGVDGALVQSQNKDNDMIELTNGSIFCACIKDKFVEALVELSKKDITHAFIEASGLADPASISSILDSIKEYTQTPYDYCGSICLTDAMYFLKHSAVLVALKRQVEYSRAVIINKIDLADEKQIAEVEEKIRELNPKADIYKTTYGNVPVKEILSNEREAEPEAQETTNTPSARPNTITMVTTEAVEVEQLKKFLSEVAPFTFRMKGFAKTTEGAKQVSAVGTEIQMEDWDIQVSETNLVIISSIGIGIISKVLESSKLNFKEKINIKS